MSKPIKEPNKVTKNKDLKHKPPVVCIEPELESQTKTSAQYYAKLAVQMKTEIALEILKNRLAKIPWVFRPPFY